MVGFGVPVFLLVYSRTFLSALALFLLIVIIDTINRPTFSALIADIVPRKKRGRINTALGESGVLIGIVSRPPAGGFLLSMAALIGSFTGGYVYELNPDYPWLVYSIVLITCFLIFAIYVHEPEKYER